MGKSQVSDTLDAPSFPAENSEEKGKRGRKADVAKNAASEACDEFIRLVAAMSECRSMIPDAEQRITESRKLLDVRLFDYIKSKGFLAES